MKRMLFNATHQEELRVAIVDGQTLVDLDIEFLNSESKRGNIYKGTVTKVEPSLEAVFVDYGAARQGFLSLKDISRNYFSGNYTASTPMAQVKVQDVINVGAEMIVQVEKNERGTKGAALTTFISLAGRYLVFLPNNPRGGGISRQVEGSNRHELKEVLSQLELPNEHSVIARTAGIGQSVENFKADLNYLVNLWKAIETTADQNESPKLIYQESSLIVRTLRDYLRDDVKQILIDNRELFEKTDKFVRDVMPASKVQVEYYDDTVPLFSKFQIEHQIKNAFEKSVNLPQGGVIVIEQTEAMVTIDVNSARSTKGADIEETALQTNLEAVEQIAKQLKVRDIGGLIVIDLIDMNSSRNRKKVEKQLIQSVETDRARTRIGKISQFGLLEMSRQRLRSSIEESSHQPCPRCKGRGFIRSVTSIGLSILRLIDEDSRKESTELIHAHLPVDVATFLINEKRHELNALESRTGTRVVIIPSRTLLTPDHRVVRFTAAEIEDDDNLSYTLETPDSPPEVYNFIHSKNSADTAAVDQESMRIEVNQTAKPEPLLKRVVSTLFGREEESDKQKPVTETPAKKPSANKRNTRGKTAPSGPRQNNRPTRSRSKSATGSKTQTNAAKGSTNTRERKPTAKTAERKSPNPRKKTAPAKRRPQPSGNSIHYPDPNSSDNHVDGNASTPKSGPKSSNRSRRSNRSRSRNPQAEKSTSENL